MLCLFAIRDNVAKTFIMGEASFEPTPLTAGYVKDIGQPIGRGIFAARTIENKEVIEICPVIRLKTPFRDLSVEVRHLCFDWEELAQEPSTRALVLGFGSLYNHANPSNATYRAEACGNVLVITAARRIEMHEQITINYNYSSGGTDSTTDNWFEARNLQVINVNG